jgi:hypothetical protein
VIFHVHGLLGMELPKTAIEAMAFEREEGAFGNLL